MRKKLLFVFSIMLACVIISLGLVNNTYAATKQDVISALTRTYKVAGKDFKIPQKYVTKGVDYLNNNDLTSEQYDKIINVISKGMEIADNAGTTKLKELSKEDLQKAIGLAMETSKELNIDIEAEMAKSNEPKTQQVVEENKPAINSGEENSNGEISGEVISGENLSEEIGSGEETSSSEEVSQNPSGSLMGLIESLRDEGGASREAIEKTVDRRIRDIFITIGIIIFVNILIIYLLFKSKWNKIIKYILIVCFILLLLVLLASLIYGLANLNEIKVVYKLYYMFI